jgi:PilZ domain
MASAKILRMKAAIDRRSEPRIPTQGTGHLIIGGVAAPAKVRIVDISRSGMQFETDEPLPLASNISVQLGDLTVACSVGNCRLHSSGRYRVGVQTKDIILP